MSGNMHDGKILVGIACYRDPELLNTINDCMQKAKHPDRLVFAIVNQYEPGAERLLDYAAESLAPADIRLVQVDYRQTGGLGWARRLMVDLWLNESWVLQLDAHTRFDQDWDEILLQEWQACGNPKAVLTTYPTAWRYEATEQGSGQESARELGRIIKDPYWDKPIHLAPGKNRVKDFIPVLQPYFRASPDDKPVPAFAAAGGFQFGPGAVYNIPFIREATFYGEEIIRSFQLYSFGFDFYAPVHLPLYHKDRGQDLPPRFWRDADDGVMKATHAKLQEQNYQFIRGFLQGTLPPEQQNYFGKVRTMDDYIAYGKQLGVEDFRRPVL